MCVREKRFSALSVGLLDNTHSVRLPRISRLKGHKESLKLKYLYIAVNVEVWNVECVPFCLREVDNLLLTLLL